MAVQRVEELFKGALQSRFDLEIIVTDNASTDSTWIVAQSLAKTRPHLKAYQFSRNFGYQNSVFTGLFLATGDAVIEMDADLEDPPEVIPEFLQKWEEGYQVAYGVRRIRHAAWWLKFLFSAFYKVLNKLSDLSIPENSGDFRLMDRKVVDVLKALPERNLYLRGLVTFLGFRQVAVPYDRQPRISGQSKFRMFHYFTLAVDALTAFTKTPLRLMTILGGALFVGSMLLASYYLISAILYGTPMPGFPTLVVLMLFLHSITLIFLGVIGEYLSRIFDDAKHRPRVIIADAIHDPEFPKYL